MFVHELLSEGCLGEKELQDILDDASASEILPVILSTLYGLWDSTGHHVLLKLVPWVVLFKPACMRIAFSVWTILCRSANANSA